MGEEPAAEKAPASAPIYQPEVAAEAILWAARHRRRELKVGLPTVIAVEGNKVLAGVMDRYLARTGYDAQQTSEPVEPNRRDNLWEPVPGDRGAHGDFGDRASSFSPHLWLDTHRGWLALGAAVLGIGYAALGPRRRSARSAQY